MGGPGSGRRYRWDGRDTTDAYQRFNLSSLYREGWLFPGSSGVTRWTRGERQTASISWQVFGSAGSAEAIELAYTVGGDEVRYQVRLTWTPCNYGGKRPWFVCPGQGCGRRVGVLYGGKYFLCRHCHNLAYQSTREDEASRHLRKAQAIRQRLGGSANMLEPFPAKPTGMHWETYEQWRDQAEQAELAYDIALMRWLSKIDQRLGKLGIPGADDNPMNG